MNWIERYSTSGHKQAINGFWLGSSFRFKFILVEWRLGRRVIRYCVSRSEREQREVFSCTAPQFLWWISHSISNAERYLTGNSRFCLSWKSNERVRRLQKKLQDLTPTGSAESNSRVRNSTSKPTRNTAATRNNQNLNEDVDDSYGRKRSSKSRQLKRESSAHAGGDYSVTATSSSKRASVTPGSIPVVREYSRGTAALKSEKTTRRGSNESWKSDGVTTINVPNPFPAE